VQRNYPSDYCAVCAPGFYTPFPNETNVTSFVACLPNGNLGGNSSCPPNHGQSGPPNDRACFSCSGGYYVAVINETTDSCAACMPGWFTPAPIEPVGNASLPMSFSSCLSCPQGMFSNESASSSCQPWSGNFSCPSGTHVGNQSNTSDYLCMACEAGYFQPFDQSVVVACERWSTVSFQDCGTTPYIVWLPGTAVSDSQCTLCERGTGHDYGYQGDWRSLPLLAAGVR
jgi:hypothetical protein